MWLCCMCVVIYGLNDLWVEEQDVGEIGLGQVCVDVVMGGICGLDLYYFWYGGFGVIWLQQLMVFGYEVVGMVVVVVLDVMLVKVGDCVVVNLSWLCGVCCYCFEGLLNQCFDMCFYGSVMWMLYVQGVFCNVFVCDVVQCVKVVDYVLLLFVVFVELFVVGLYVVLWVGLLIGKCVFVLGCGLIGVLVVVVVCVYGVVEIVVIDVVDVLLEIVSVFGVDCMINVVVDVGWVECYGVGKGMFDVMIECLGNVCVLCDGLDVMCLCGIVVQFGFGGDVSLLQNVVVVKELLICGLFCFYVEFVLVVQLINVGCVDLWLVVMCVFLMCDVNFVFELVGDCQCVMKVLIDFVNEVV